MRDYEIIHEQDQQIFYINLEDDQKAYLKYQLLENRHIDFTSTLVPQTHRKRGLAAELVEAGFAWADQQELSIVASCWYAAKKLEERRR